MEEVVYGLSTQEHPDILLQEFPGEKARGVIANENIAAGRFVCEYQTYLPPYPRSGRAAKEEEYSYNGKGCYILEAQDKDGKWLF